MRKLGLGETHYLRLWWNYSVRDARYNKIHHDRISAGSFLVNENLIHLLTYNYIKIKQSHDSIHIYYTFKGLFSGYNIYNYDKC